MVAQIDADYLRTRPGRLWSRMLGYALFEGRPLTTRGRWINPLVFAQFAVLRRLPPMKPVRAPIYILGTGRSGTTILGIVLSMHRAVGFLNEPKAVWAALRSDEDLIGSYHRGPARYRLGAADATPAAIRGAHRIFGAYLRSGFCTRFVDKYPEMIFRVPFLRAIFPDARFLFLSRDGWETCASIEAWSGRLGRAEGGERHDWWGADDRKWHLLVEQIVPEHPDLAPHHAWLAALGDHRLRAAVEWIVTMREGLTLLEGAPMDVLHVPYARLCADPAGMMDRIATFAGLSPDPVFRDYAARALKPPSAGAPFPLPDALRDAFEETQARLAEQTRQHEP